MDQPRPTQWHRLLWAIYARPGWRWFVALPLLVVGTFDTVIAQFLTKEQQESLPRVIEILLVLPWWLWIIALLTMTLVIIILSAGYQLRQSNQALNKAINAPSGVTISQMVEFVQTEIERALQGVGESSFFPVLFHLGDYVDVSVNVHRHQGGGGTLSGLMAKVHTFNWSTGTISLIINGQRTSNLALYIDAPGMVWDTTGSDSLVSGDLTNLRCELVADGQVVASDQQILNLGQ